LDNNVPTSPASPRLQDGIDQISKSVLFSRDPIINNLDVTIDKQNVIKGFTVINEIGNSRQVTEYSLEANGKTFSMKDIVTGQGSEMTSDPITGVNGLKQLKNFTNGLYKNFSSLKINGELYENETFIDGVHKLEKTVDANIKNAKYHSILNQKNDSKTTDHSSINIEKIGSGLKPSAVLDLNPTIKELA
jgi:hypothetical protein